MQCPRWPGVINDRDYCDTVSAACCSYLEFVFSVWCLVQISGLEGGGRGGAGQQIILCTHRTTHNTALQSRMVLGLLDMRMVQTQAASMGGTESRDREP